MMVVRGPVVYEAEVAIPPLVDVPEDEAALLYLPRIFRAKFPCYCACWLDDGEGADGDSSNHNITRQHAQ